MAHALQLVFDSPASPDVFEGIVGRHVALERVFQQLRRVALGSASVVIVGETGTGKELFARALHRLRRPQGPLAVLNCGGIPADLCESELFGHERGAFTGAWMPKRGVFEEADKGMLFLDEIGELPLALQPKLLRALETNRVRRVGGTNDRVVDIEIISATNRDLAVEVQSGRFRADLYHRLATVVIRLPALRERASDISLLVEYFLAEERRLGRSARLGPGVHQWLMSQIWLGNVRELRNAVRRAVLLGSEVLEVKDFEQQPLIEATPDSSFEVSIVGRKEEDILVDVYRKTLALCNGNARCAARKLGLARSTFADRLQRYGIREKRNLDTGSESDSARYTLGRTDTQTAQPIQRLPRKGILQR